MYENGFFEVEVTKTGRPALWECGGGMSRTGKATVICDGNGNRKTPLFVRNGGTLSNSNHALIPLSEGDYVISIFQRGGEIEVIRVLRLGEFVNGSMKVTEEYNYSDGEWDIDNPDYLNEAIDACYHKSRCYHCRTPYFVKETVNN